MKKTREIRHDDILREVREKYAKRTGSVSQATFSDNGPLRS